MASSTEISAETRKAAAAEVLSVAQRAQRVLLATIHPNDQAAFWCGHTAATPGCGQCAPVAQARKRGRK